MNFSLNKELNAMGRSAQWISKVIHLIQGTACFKSDFFLVIFGFLQDHYVFIVSQFMYIPWNYTRKQAAVRASVQNGDSCTPSINIGAAEAFESEITEYIKEQV